MAQTEELKIVISAEERASREIERLTGNLKRFQGQMKKSFTNPLDTGVLNSKAITEGFKKYADGLSQINERHTRWANNERRQNRMTAGEYDRLNRQLEGFITKEGRLRILRGKQVDQFVDLTRKVRAYEQVWGRQHERYLSSLSREQQMKDQVERAKDRLGQLGFQNESRRRANIDALDRQRSRAFLRSESEKAAASRSLDRQRSRAYIAAIREEERAGRKANADKLREELRVARTQESARRSLERQRSHAYVAEENRKQRLRINSMNLQMRQEARAQREAERHEAAVHRGRIQTARGGLNAAASLPGQAVSAAVPIALATGAITAAVTKIVETGFAARRSASTAEANMEMFGNVSPAKIQEIRRGWLDRAGIANGFAPSAAMNAFTEVKKAGIGKDDDDVVRQVTMSIMKGAAGLDLNIAETTKLVGRLSTLTQNPSDFKPEAISGMLNNLAVVAKYTAADSNELVSSLRRGAGVLGSSKMSVGELTAFTGTGISAGMQEGKAGTFMDFQINELVNAKNSRGQRRADLQKGLELAKVGNLSQVSKQAANDPAALLTKLYGNMSKMAPEKAGQIATLIGMREWRGEMLQMMKAFPTLVEALKEVRDPANSDHLEKANLLKMGTLSGVMSQINAMSKNLWEAVGKGLEGPFREISRYVLAFADSIGGTSDVIQAHIQTLIDGFVDGLGFTSITEILTTLFGKPGEFNFSTLDSWFRFAQGFGKGVRAVIDTFKNLFSGSDMKAEDIGEWVAKIGLFGSALVAASPAITLLGALALGLTALFSIISGAASGIALLRRNFAGSMAEISGAGLFRGIGLMLSRFFSLSIVAEIGANRAQISAWMITAFTTIWDILKATLSSGISELGTWIRKELTLKKMLNGAVDEITPAPIQRQGGWGKFFGFGGSTPEATEQSQQPQTNGAPRVQQQSFQTEENPLAGLIQKASYTGYDDRSDATERLADNVRNMGARFQLAALSGPAMASGLGSGFSGGGGGSSGGGGGGGGGGSSFGKNFFTPGGMNVPSWYGGGSKAGAGAPNENFTGNNADVLKQAAGSLGIPAKDLATVISYETGGKFSPSIKGGKGGNYQGLIQFGPAERAKYGVTGNETFAEQMPKVVRFLKDRGLKPGMGINQLYATINGGNPYVSQNASDGNGTIASHVAKMQATHGARAEAFLGASTNGGLTPSLTGLTSGSGTGAAGGATDVAMKFLGKNENTNRRELSQFVGHDVAGNINAWCARFVNSSLQAVGVKGTGSAMANSFLRWGQGVDAAAVQKGDVAVEHRNKGVDAGGGHVGLATGNKRINPRTGALEIETVSGNHGDEVARDWTDARKLAIRRSADAVRASVDGTVAAAARANAVRLPEGMTSTGFQPGAGNNGSAISGVPAAERAIGNVPMPARRPDVAGGGGGAAGSGQVHITQHINGGQNNPQEIANLSQRQITKDWNHRSHDVEFDMA